MDPGRRQIKHAKKKKKRRFRERARESGSAVVRLFFFTPSWIFFFLPSLTLPLSFSSSLTSFQLSRSAPTSTSRSTRTSRSPTTPASAPPSPRSSTSSTTAPRSCWRRTSAAPRTAPRTSSASTPSSRACRSCSRAPRCPRSTTASATRSPPRPRPSATVRVFFFFQLQHFERERARERESFVLRKKRNERKKKNSPPLFILPLFPLFTHQNARTSHHRRAPRPRERPLLQGRDQERARLRQGARRQRRDLRQRRLRHGPPRARLDRGRDQVPLPFGRRLLHAEGARLPRRRRRQPQEALRGHRRRVQGLVQDRRHRDAHQQGRQDLPGRGHDLHLLQGAGQGSRRLPGRGGQARPRPRADRDGGEEGRAVYPADGRDRRRQVCRRRQDAGRLDRRDPRGVDGTRHRARLAQGVPGRSVRLQAGHLERAHGERIWVFFFFFPRLFFFVCFLVSTESSLSVETRKKKKPSSTLTHFSFPLFLLHQP